MPNQIPVTLPAKRILNTVKDELFPRLENAKEILKNSFDCKISLHVYSRSLSKLETEYASISAQLFSTIRKLQTPDILFEGIQDSPEVMATYIQYQNAFKEPISQGLNYLEIINRTLDRKAQRIQYNRTFVLSIMALIVSLFA